MLVRRVWRVRFLGALPVVLAYGAAALAFLAGFVVSGLVRDDAGLLVASVLATVVGPLVVWEVVRWFFEGRWCVREMVDAFVREMPPELLTVAEAKAVLASGFLLPISMESLSTRVEGDAGGWLRRGRAPRGVARSLRAIRFLRDAAPGSLACFADRIDAYMRPKGWNRSSLFAFGSSVRVLGSVMEWASGPSDPKVQFFYDLAVSSGFGTASYLGGSEELYEEGFDLALRAFDMGAERRELLVRMLSRDAQYRKRPHGFSLVYALVGMLEGMPPHAVSLAHSLLGTWSGDLEGLCEVSGIL